MGKVGWGRRWEKKTDKEREIKRWSEKKKESEWRGGRRRRGRCPLITISIVGICICILLLPKMQMQLTANPTKSLVGALYVCVCVCVCILLDPVLSVIIPCSFPAEGCRWRKYPWPLQSDTCLCDGWREGGTDWRMDGRIDRLSHEEEGHY